MPLLIQKVKGTRAKGKGRGSRKSKSRSASSRSASSRSRSSGPPSSRTRSRSGKSNGTVKSFTIKVVDGGKSKSVTVHGTRLVSAISKYYSENEMDGVLHVSRGDRSYHVSRVPSRPQLVKVKRVRK